MKTIMNITTINVNYNLQRKYKSTQHSINDNFCKRHVQKV